MSKNKLFKKMTSVDGVRFSKFAWKKLKSTEDSMNLQIQIEFAVHETSMYEYKDDLLII